MRKFWITFRLHADILIEGDIVTDMADGDELTAEYLQDVKHQIRTNVLANLAKEGRILKQMGQAVILACIPLDS